MPPVAIQVCYGKLLLAIGDTRNASFKRDNEGVKCTAEISCLGAYTSSRISPRPECFSIDERRPQKHSQPSRLARCGVVIRNCIRQQEANPTGLQLADTAVRPVRLNVRHRD